MSKQLSVVADQETENIVNGLTGYRGLKLGKKYYVFTVTFDYIGTVTKMDEHCFTLDDAHIVMNAGSSATAVSDILAKKVDPEVWEQPHKEIVIQWQALNTTIAF